MAQGEESKDPEFKELPEAKKRLIVEALVKRKAIQKCPRCEHPSFTLLGGYFRPPVSTQMSGPMILGGHTLPSVITVCENCGFMSWHALGVLGLLEVLEKSDEDLAKVEPATEAKK